MQKETTKSKKSFKAYDLESQKTVSQTNEKHNTFNTQQSEEKEENQKKQSFFQRLCGFFQLTNNYDGEWLEEDIIRLINKRSQNGRQIKKFIKTLCENQKFIYDKSCEFSEKVNSACEQYFYSQDQKDEIKKKFSEAATKRYEKEKELTAIQFIQQRDEKISKQREDQESKKGSPQIKGLQKQISGQSNPQLIALKKSNMNQSINDQNKSSMQSQIDFDIEKQNSGKQNSNQDQDDFSVEQIQHTQQQQRNSEKEDNNEHEDNQSGDEEDEEEDDDDYQGQKRKNQNDEDIDLNFTDSDEDDNNNGESDEEDSDNDSEEDDQEEDDQHNTENKSNSQKQAKENLTLKKQKPLFNALDNELIKGSSIENQNYRQSKTRHFSLALATKEPKFFEILENKVQRIRVTDKNNRNIISFRILDQSIDSYLPDIINRMSNQFYSGAFFQNVIFNESSYFDLEQETDEHKKNLIKKLTEPTKSLSFGERAKELIKFYEDQGEDLKIQLKNVRQDIEQEQLKQQYYDGSIKTQQAFQYQEYLNRQKAKTLQAKNNFKKIFARYLFHREEDIFYLVYHIFNKQIVYHSDCLDQLNKFDRWILVNQGDLEKLKEKKKQKLQQLLMNDKETIADMMKTFLQEVDKYLAIVHNLNQSSTNQPSITKRKDKKEFNKKKQRK
ncbi:hypothetical protein TTHERM_00294510 (macronuclear) [Tetrahymena thermophila SB210]|uniref:Uncharacterized protein n=1 Tax=Tetrahymena thermophila (strain SB210) TaxID=312017 RepID=I7M0W5_TETTS|nr:hypothetical protein TTHERM_00294510 [Tetrahymena thermophila SB210]EAR92838.2 hypothetical protein TTHERM_00294510 [Tetrahymena thermophila SB210]|eukprot:XP_001013083.2 hypothetical protein TTHERM_00294510 [Tetrahymena thermophila SB210]